MAKKRVKPPLVFLSLLALSLTLRALWFFLRAGHLGAEVGMRVLNRGSLLIFFSAYSLCESRGGAGPRARAVRQHDNCSCLRPRADAALRPRLLALNG